MKYFAYGMNTNLDQMSMRCPLAQSLGSAQLPNHEFRFSIHADVIVKPGATTDGVLWEITDTCLQALDSLEGFPTYYDRKWVQVIHNGKPVTAMTYYMVGDLPNEAPSNGYLQMLYKGYKDHRVSTLQIQESLDQILAYHTDFARKSQHFFG
jgi:gamma-glutamylcyclotransferase (GGCT)/AIG2-like uncharacterized protein YtfP